ncbi:Na+/H+ antiporter subunit E [Halosolutus halophilus]|uniref:Na+/H+ antiporter subunit E n=1 Tax=Halosolutus halophilus TaxID=1552990 RepID=UPI0022352120|nr:Na+/H+ antiporter subunit E [Halosolutus halophilus]
MRVRTWPVAGVVFALLWIFVRGVELTPSAVIGQFLLGLVVGLPVAFVFRRLYVKRIDLGRGARALPAAARYLATFSWEVVRANLDVAYRVLSPGMPIEPEVILVPLRVETDLAITTIANSITITPGTVTLDYDEETNALYVHAVDGRDPEAIAAPIREWEDYALEMFDEEASPDDRPPAIVVSGGERDSTSGRERRGVDDE